MSRLPLLSCEGISKAYGVHPLFEGLSFGLAEGDRVGLVGPNGSGKTTLLKVLAGLEPPDAGTRSQRRFTRLGYVPQDPTFPGDRTVEAVLTEALPAAERDGFETVGRVAAMLGRAGFTDSRRTVGVLSAGWRKRLAIARELVVAPDVLLMDEPTNHLDVEGILWLEALLRTEVPAVLVVSHDRYFLEHVALRVLELNRCYPGGLFQAEGRYSDYLVRRDEALREQAAYQDTLANTVRREVEWLRRGPKARTRKGQARVKAAGRLIQELDEVRARAAGAAAGIEFTASGRQSKKLLVATDVAKTVGGVRLLAGLNLTLTPGMRLGLLGASGSGKSTLLNLLAGTLAPDAGRIERAEGLRVVRFDQEREGLDPAVSLRRALAPEGDAVVYRDRSVHVVAWAKRFLLERVSTLVLALDGTGGATFFADYAQWESAHEEAGRDAGDRIKAPARTAIQTRTQPAAREGLDVRRLTYLEKRDWQHMEQTILEAEEACAACQEAVEDPAVASDPIALRERWAALEAARAEVDRLYGRWAELEEKQR